MYIRNGVSFHEKDAKKKLYAKDFQIDCILKVYFTPSGFVLIFDPYISVIMSSLRD